MKARTVKRPVVAAIVLRLVARAFHNPCHMVPVQEPRKPQ